MLPIFLVGTFFTWTDGMTTSMLGYVSSIFADISPILIPIIGVGVGLIVITAIIHAIRGG